MDTRAQGGQVDTMTPSSSVSSSPAGGGNQDQTSTAGASASVNAADSSGITSTAGSVDGNSHAQGQGTLFAFVLALLAYGGGAMAAVLAESKDTISGWRTVPKVLYGLTAVLAIASLAIGFMAAGRHAAAVVAGNGGGGLRISSSCAKLGAILSSVLLVVVLCCKLGRWGCATGVPSAAVLAAVMAAVWIFGDERAAARAVPNCWRRIKDLLCGPRLLRPPSTRDSERASAGREEGDGMELAGRREGEDGMV